MSLPSLLRQARASAEAGRLDRALDAAERAFRQFPGHPEASQLFGRLLIQAARPAEAVPVFERAVAAAPGRPGPLNDLANALVAAERHAEAVARWREALRCELTFLPAYFGLAHACAAAGDAEAAVQAAEEGLLLHPHSPELTFQRATALEAAGRLDEALQALDTLATSHPRQVDLLSRRITLLHYLDRPAEIHAQALRAYHDALPTPPPAPPRPAADPGRPLRLGVISADLRTHSVAYFFAALAEQLPPGLELIVFSTSAPVPADPWNQRFRARARRWLEVATVSDAALEAAIRAEGIDVLLDLAGHFSGSRLRALDRRPAPVIVTAIGYPGSTGHPAVGWRVVDSITDPPGAEAHATERLLRLDPCFLCYTPPEPAPEPELPAAGTPFTFGCFNLANKISDGCLTVWSGALAAVPDSRLLLKSGAFADAGVRDRLRRRLVAAGIAPERVTTLAPVPSLQEHLALYRQVHVALDTLPYSGTTTTCEALWMGVPVLTLLGERHAGRVSASLLRAAGCGAWVAETREQFAALARGLAADPATLRAFRTGAREQLRRSPLLDARAYADRMAAALRGLVA